jgi:hypothetical protein
MLVREQIMVLAVLTTAILVMANLEHFDNLSGKLWISVLSVQALPYLATLVTVLISIAPNYGKNANLSTEDLDE